MIADMATKLEAAKNLVYKTAYLMDTHQDARWQHPWRNIMRLRSATRLQERQCRSRGYGFIKDYKVERMYRDCRVFTIYEGTSQVQQMVIAGKLLKK